MKSKAKPITKPPGVKAGQTFSVVGSAEQGQEAPGATAVDPGPPPTFPVAPGSGDAIQRIREAGQMAGISSAREHVLAIQTLRHPPEISRYKAEVLSWLDAMEAYGG